MAVRRLGWGVADQAVSSLSNFAVSIYVVHALGAAQFGAFSLAYVTYGFVLNASRGLSTDPLMVRFSGVTMARWRRATGSATGTALLVGMAGGILALAVASLFPEAAQQAFVALGLTLPGLMLQDSWRFSFFAHQRGFHAFLSDTIWAVTLIPALVAVRMSGHGNVFWYTFAWGATACIAGVVGLWQARLVPRPTSALIWLKLQGDLGWRYLVEGTSNSAVMQVRGYGTGAIVGLAAVGYLQASVTLMGPLTVLFLGMGLVTIPEGSRVLRRSPHRFTMFCVLVSAGLSLIALVWGVILLVAVPRGLGSAFLGPVWKQTYPLVLPQMLYVVASGSGGGAGTGLHALGAAKRSLRTVLFTSLLSAVFALVGALVSGVAGTLYGLALASFISTWVTWRQYFKALRESGKVPGAARHEPPRPAQREVPGAGRREPPGGTWREVPGPARRDSPRPAQREVPGPARRDSPRPAQREVPGAGRREPPGGAWGEDRGPGWPDTERDGGRHRRAI
jgi:O-antigen/teichoic acid export membrane protein